MDRNQSEKIVGVSSIPEGSKLASRTPQKTSEPLLSEPKLPERHMIIQELFDQMTCSLRLLNLCKKSPTFRNVSSQVELLSKRKFLYSHLAQMKYLLPEAIRVDQMLVHDKKTLCMRPEVKITLLFDGVDGHPEQSRVMVLREMFSSRLEDFVRSHPEACDIPEAMLPQLFDQSSQANTPEDVAGNSVILSQPTSVVGNLLPVSSSHLQLLRKHFSEKVAVPDSEKTGLLVSSSPLPSVHDQEIEGRHEIRPDSLCVQLDILNEQGKSDQDEAIPECFPGFATGVNSDQLTNTGASVGSLPCQSPAVKISSSAESILIETPAQVTPKRAILNGDNDQKPTCSEKCSSSQKSTKRSLNFSMESDGICISSRFSLDETESGQHAPSHSICATVPTMESRISTSRAVAQAQQSFSETDTAMCQQLSSCLPGTVAVIDDIFRAVGCSSITKEELVHKIILNNCDIVERREVEEQVELLEKLVPDWIRRKSTPSGDIIYSVKRVSDMESILSRLIST